MTTTDERPDEAAPPPDPNAVPITVNGRAIAARKGELVIAAASATTSTSPGSATTSG